MDGRLTLRQLNRATLERQSLLERPTGIVADVVGRLAGLQAQHANAPYVALWSRRVSQTIADLEAALHDRSVVKATLMRSTLHLVDAADYPAFDLASAEARVANWLPTARRAGVDVGALHARLLAYCQTPRTVAEMEWWTEQAAPDLASASPAGVRSAAFRVASAAGGLVHVPPSGLWKSHRKPTYVDARIWLPGGATPSVDDALTIAIERYLGAYGPASLADIGKWVGQPRSTRVRAAIDALAERISRWTGPDGRPLVDLADRTVPSDEVAVPSRFLSRWDSVLIAYDVRDRILPDAYRPAVVKKNGDFLPTFLVDGYVAGLWSVESGPKEAVLRLEPFASVPPAECRALEDEGERLVRYVASEAARHVVTWGA